MSPGAWLNAFLLRTYTPCIRPIPRPRNPTNCLYCDV
jgi:hypothetical protein